MKTTELKDAIQQKYGSIARQVTDGETEASCCGSSTGGGCGCESTVGGTYDATQVADVPQAALSASLGSGNPTAGAQLRAGETVLDLGSGGGIDAFLAAKAVGPAGTVYGLDMTDEMLELARGNQERAGLQNVEFLKGEIERVPLPDESVDVVVSNCVINLSADKPRVLREAFRVLRPGGRFTVSDIIVRGTLPDSVRRDTERWVGCVAGALTEEEFRRGLSDAGFVDVAITPTHVHQPVGHAAGTTCGTPETSEGEVASALIEARKP